MPCPSPRAARKDWTQNRAMMQSNLLSVCKADFIQIQTVQSGLVIILTHHCTVLYCTVLYCCAVLCCILLVFRQGFSYRLVTPY